MSNLAWSEEDVQRAVEYRKYLREQIEHYKDAPPFLDMLDTLETDAQKLEWCKIAAQDYFDRLNKVVGWLFGYRYALAKRFAQDAHPGVDWIDIPMSRRREIHGGLADLLGFNDIDISKELSGYFELVEKYFEFKGEPDVREQNSGQAIDAACAADYHQHCACPKTCQCDCHR